MDGAVRRDEVYKYVQGSRMALVRRYDCCGNCYVHVPTNVTDAPYADSASRRVGCTRTCRFFPDAHGRLGVFDTGRGVFSLALSCR